MECNTLITEIPTLGKATLPSPLQKRADEMGSICFVSDQSRVIIEVDDGRINGMIKDQQPLPCFELAGPRPQIFLDCRDLSPNTATI